MDINKIKSAAEEVIRYMVDDVHSLDRLTESVSRFIAEYVNLIKTVPAENIPLKRRMEYQWSQRAKEVGLLLRDIVFRLYRDRQFVADGIIDHALIQERNKASQELFAEANEQLIESYNKLSEAVNKQLPEDPNWKHYNSPAPIFFDQMDALRDQVRLINEAEETLNKDRDYVIQLQDINNESAAKLNTDITALRSNVKSVKEVVLKIESLEDSINIVSAKSILKKSIEKIEEIKNSYAVEKIFNENFGTQTIPVAVADGQLIIKELSLLSQITSWVMNTIYPSIYEAQRSMVLICDNILIALINVQNRLELSTSETNEFNEALKLSIIEPLSGIGINPDELFNEINSSIDYVNVKFIENVKVSNIFDIDNLLIQDQSNSAISQIKTTAPRWISGLPLKKLAALYTKTYRQYINPAKASESSINAIDFIDKKIIKSLDQYNHSLFLNKGFLGKSFIVNRPSITGPINNTYQSWLEGFRGSYLVYGSRLSGKSAILKSVLSTDTEIEHLELKPETLITFQGRKHHTENNLGASLSFIDKYVYNKRVVVIIDDIELWRGKNTSLYDNIRSLLEFMGRSYKRIFFLVATNQWSKEQLDLYFNFSNQFVASASSNRMTQKEIQQALLIRHGATISELVYQDDKPQDSMFLQQQTKRIAKASRGNIGQSLLNWCRFSFQKPLLDEDLLDMPAKLVSIIKEHREIFLFMLRNVCTNELELNNTIGTRFVKEVAPDIQKLVSYKLLNRSTEGDIEINEYLVSDIEAIMKYTTNKVTSYA